MDYEEILNLQPVQSSNIASIGYRPGILFVKFINGTVYCYVHEQITPEFYTTLLSAPSIGKSLQGVIINNPNVPYYKLTTKISNNVEGLIWYHPKDGKSYIYTVSGMQEFQIM